MSAAIRDPRDRIRKLRAVAAHDSGAMPAERETAARLAAKLEQDLPPTHTVVPSRSFSREAFDELLRQWGRDYSVASLRPGETEDFGYRTYRAGHDPAEIRAFAARLKIGARVVVRASGGPFRGGPPVPDSWTGVVSRFTPSGRIMVKPHLHDGFGSLGEEQAFRANGLRSGETGSDGWRSYLANPSWPWAGR